MESRKIKKAGMILGNVLTRRMKTACHFLWDSVFIDHKGDVYACCHSKPAILGNIYRHRLADIWTRRFTLKMYRQLSLRHGLPCFFECTILSQQEKAGEMVHPVYPRHPMRVWILYGEACNLHCAMCWQDHHSALLLDSEALKEQIDWEYVQDIELQGGEILAMKKAKDFYLWLTQEMNKKVNLITNGVLINDEWAEYLVKGSRWIQISVNAATQTTHEQVNLGSDYHKVMTNIHTLVERKRHHRSEIEIIYKYTIVPENIHEVVAAAELANALGCDKIAYGYDASVHTLLTQDTALHERLTQQIQRLLEKDLPLHIEQERLEYLDLVAPEKATREKA